MFYGVKFSKLFEKIFKNLFTIKIEDTSKIRIRLLFVFDIVIINFAYVSWRWFKSARKYMDNYRVSAKSLEEVRMNPTPSKVLVIEARDGGHSELLASDAYYFQRLNFKDVDVILNPALANEKPFSRMESTEGLHILELAYPHVKMLMEENYFSKYKHIFINSDTYFFKNVLGETKPGSLVDEFIENREKFGNEYSITSYFHEAFFDHRRYLEQDVAVAFLYDYICEDRPGTTAIAPIYFGYRPEKKKAGKTVFSVFGWVIKEARDYDLLLATVSRLMGENIGDFELYIVGNYMAGFGRDKTNRYGRSLHGRLSKYDNVHFTGRASYPEMYRIAGGTNYVLFLINPYYSQQAVYIRDKSTGTTGLTFGFSMVPILESRVAEAYGFDRSNSIIYEGNDLYSAMVAAMETSEKEYEKQVASLNKYGDRLEKESIKNLRDSFNS